METRLNTVYYLFYYNYFLLHRIYVHIYLSGPIFSLKHRRLLFITL